MTLTSSPPPSPNFDLPIKISALTQDQESLLENRIRQFIEALDGRDVGEEGREGGMILLENKLDFPRSEKSC